MLWNSVHSCRSASIPNNFAVELRVDMSLNDELQSRCWIIVGRQDNFFLVFPYWIETPADLGLANNFMRDQVYMQDGPAAWSGDADRPVQLSDSPSPSACNWHGFYNFANWRELVAECWTMAGEKTEIRDSSQRRLTRWSRLVAGMPEAPVTSSDERGSFGVARAPRLDSGESSTPSTRVFKLTPCNLTRTFSFPSSGQSETRQFHIAEMEYLSGGRHIICTYSQDDVLEQQLPQEITVLSNDGQVRYRCLFLKYHRLPDSTTSLDRLRDHIRHIA